MDNHRACREVGCIDIEQSNPYLNNKRAFTVDRSLQGAVPGIKGKKESEKGIVWRLCYIRNDCIIQMSLAHRAIAAICIFRSNIHYSYLIK